jgi:biotin carboxylase
MKTVLFVFPTDWDRKQLNSCRQAWCGRYEILFTEPADDDCPWDFDVLSFIDQTADRYRGRIDGVMSSSDYPGATVAAAVAQRLGLPGSPPEAVIRSSHKYYSRLAQREAVPQATADFDLVPVDRVSEAAANIRFPCYIKPVKGAFSIMSRRLDSPAELIAFLCRPAAHEFTTHYPHIFNQLVRRFTSFDIDGSYFLAEQLLHGQQVTVEGFACRGRVDLLGIVDSVMYPGTNSFARFDYPSSLDAAVQTRMHEIARRVVEHLGLSNSLFNIEMMYDTSRDQIHIIEINPRICGQFADLYQMVDGTNTYEIALALATGGEGVCQPGQGVYRTASSLALRVFNPARVARAPSEDEVTAAESAIPGTRVWIECVAGDTLANFELDEDGHSHRYAVINVGADSREGVMARGEQIQERLSYRFIAI